MMTHLRSEWRHIARSFLRAFGCLWLAASALALEVPPGVTAHRVDADLRAADGWARAASTGGHFSVDLPARFSDFTLEEQDPASPTKVTYLISGRSPDQVHFGASRIVHRQKRPGTEKYFMDFAGEPKNTVTSSQLTYKGFKAEDRAYTNGVRCGFARTIFMERDVILLIVEATKPACDDLKKQSERFFASATFEPI